MDNLEDRFFKKVDEFESMMRQNRADRFGNTVAVCVAIISAFLAFSSIKNGNVGQGIQRAQRQAASYWNQYQAKRLRQFALDMKISELTAVVADGVVAMTPQRRKVLDRWSKSNNRYKFELHQLAAKARAKEAYLSTRNVLGDQLDVAEAFLALALALLAVAALTKIGWVLGIGMMVGAVGVSFGTAAYMEWTWLHPAFLIALFEA